MSTPGVGAIVALTYVAAINRAYSVIRHEGQDDYWLNIGLVFPHKDNGGFNIMLQAFPLDGKIVCREITAEEADDPAPEPADQAGRRPHSGRPTPLIGCPNELRACRRGSFSIPARNPPAATRAISRLTASSLSCIMIAISSTGKPPSINRCNGAWMCSGIVFIIDFLAYSRTS